MVGLFAEMVVAEFPWLCLRQGQVLVFPGEKSISSEPGRAEGLCFEPLIVLPRRGAVALEAERKSEAAHTASESSPAFLAARLVYGARATFGFTALVLCISLLSGLLLGWAAGYWGGIWEHLLARPLELVEAFPVVVVLAIVYAVAPQKGTLALVLSASLIRLAEVARLVRAELMRIDRAPFVVAARAIGCSRLRLLRRHVLPSLTGPLLVQAFSGTATLILLESSAAYLKLGSGISWGKMLADGVHAGQGAVVWAATLAIGLSLGACYFSSVAITEAVYDAAIPSSSSSSS